MEPAWASERARFWGLLGFWDTTDVSNHPLHRLPGDYKDKWLLGLLLRLCTFDVPGLANSIAVRITVAIRSNELSGMKKAMRSELQTLSLVAVLFATVGIAPFAAPPPELVQLQIANQTDVENNLLFGEVTLYRKAYAACWTMSLLLNGAVVLSSTLLLLYLPQLTPDVPRLHRRTFCFFTAGSIATLFLGILCFLCGCLITVEFLYRTTALSTFLFFFTASIIIVLIIVWFWKVADYVCGGARQVHYLAQYYAMKHYYLSKLVDVPFVQGGQQQAFEKHVKQLEANGGHLDRPDDWRTYPKNFERDSGKMCLEEYSHFYDYDENGVEKGFKAESSPFSEREKALAFEIGLERLKGLLRNLEVSERRTSHLKYELACFNQTEKNLPPSQQTSSSPSETRKYKHHWPQDKPEKSTCRDVEHVFTSAELSFLTKELGNEASRILLLRRVIHVQYAALVMIKKLNDLDLDIEREIGYQSRMITFEEGLCDICVELPV